MGFWSGGGGPPSFFEAVYVDHEPTALIYSLNLLNVDLWAFFLPQHDFDSVL